MIPYCNMKQQVIESADNCLPHRWLNIIYIFNVIFFTILKIFSLLKQSIYKRHCHDIPAILLKVALNTINQPYR